MTKRKTGVFETTYEERKLWLEVGVSYTLANHYEQMAQQYRKEAARAGETFWAEVKQKRTLPQQHGMITVIDGGARLKVETNKEASALLKAPKKNHKF